MDQRKGYDVVEESSMTLLWSHTPSASESYGKHNWPCHLDLFL